MDEDRVSTIARLHQRFATFRNTDFPQNETATPSGGVSVGVRAAARAARTQLRPRSGSGP